MVLKATARAVMASRLGLFLIDVAYFARAWLHKCGYKVFWHDFAMNEVG